MAMVRKVAAAGLSAKNRGVHPNNRDGQPWHHHADEEEVPFAATNAIVRTPQFRLQGCSRKSLDEEPAACKLRDERCLLLIHGCENWLEMPKQEDGFIYKANLMILSSHYASDDPQAVPCLARCYLENNACCEDSVELTFCPRRQPVRFRVE
jgi:hypothetical protein